MINTVITVLLVLLSIAAVALVVMYFVGRRLQEKQAASQPAFDAAKQLVTMLPIDKKKVRLKEAGFPKLVWEQTPFYLRWMKVPVVKAKVGPKIITMMADETAFQQLPLKQECKVIVSGIYIVEVKGVRRCGSRSAEEALPHGPHPSQKTLRQHKNSRRVSACFFCASSSVVCAQASESSPRRARISTSISQSFRNSSSTSIA